jgi:hypothetical protein
MMSLKVRQILELPERLSSLILPRNMIKNIPIKVIADQETRAKRIGECQQCEHLVKRKRCGKCGCFVRAKVTFEKSKCPIDKW